jgi:hypothetical protein
MYVYLNEKEAGAILESAPYLSGEYKERFPSKTSGAVTFGVDFAKAAEHLKYDPAMPQKEAARLIFNDLEKRANTLFAQKPVKGGEERGTHRARFLHTTPKGYFRAVLSFEEARFTFDENPAASHNTTAGIEVTLCPL